MRYGKTFFKYILSNMAVVVFSLLVLIPMYHQWMETDRQKQLSETLRQTEIGFYDFLSSMKSIENLSYILIKNQLYQEVSRLGGNYDSTCYVDVNKLRTYVSELLFAHNDIITDFILTFQRSDIVITSDRVYLGDSKLYPDYFKYPGYNEADYRYMIQYTDGRSSLGRSQYTYSLENKMQKTMTYLLPLKVRGLRNEVVLEILLDVGQLQSQFFSIQPSAQGQTTLLNYAQEPLLSTGFEYNDGSLLRKLTQPIEVVNSSKNGTLAVFSLQAEDGSYSLRTIRPMSEYSEGMRRVWQLLALHLLAALGVSFLAALLNSIWQYKPVQLVARVLHQDEANSERFRDDYRYLYSGMMKIQNDRERLATDIVQTRERLETLKFSQMLMNGQTAGEWSSNLPECCLCLNLWSEDVQSLPDEPIFAAFAADPARALYRLAPGNLFLILDSHVFSEEGAAEQAEAVIQAVGLTLYCGIARVERGDISEAYKRSVYALHFRSSTTERVLVDRPADTTDSRDIFPENQRERLISLLMSAQSEAVCRLLRELEMQTEQRRPSRKALQYLYIGLASSLTQVIGRRQLSQEALDVERISLSRSVGQIFERLIELAEGICREIAEKRRSSNIGLREEILQYIHESFTQPELYNGGIAERFHISEKYLSEFFREQTGNSVGKYIEKLRLEYACKLILESNYSMKEIGERSGFHNQSTFYKSFNRVYGISPKQYKNHE